MNFKRFHLRHIAHAVLASIGAIALSACSLVTDFSPDGKPCDNYQKCEEGYYCKLSNDETGEGTCEVLSDKPTAILPLEKTPLDELTEDEYSNEQHSDEEALESDEVLDEEEE